MELKEEVLQQCKGFTCKDEDITEFFPQDYAENPQSVELYRWGISQVYTLFS